MNSLLTHFSIKPEVEAALSNKLPVLAFESTIIAHGMPYPDNLDFVRKAEDIARKNSVTPATIAIIDGKIHIGLEDSQLEILTSNKAVEKVAVRDIAFAVTQKLTGATTVSATMHLAHLAGIDVFASGGIGGVHRNSETAFDISQDLIELSRTPMIVVSAGVKAILDVPKTIEYLETFSIPVVGYKTNEFPVFYSRASGIFLTSSCNTIEEVVRLFVVHKEIGLQSAILVANPIPKSNEIPKNVIDKYIDIAIAECEKNKLSGKDITPFLLKRIVELTGGQSLRTNIALALNNITVGAQIAKQLTKT